MLDPKQRRFGKLGDYRLEPAPMPRARTFLARAPSGQLVALFGIQGGQIAEAHGLARLSHPNIASVVEVLTDPEPFAVVRCVRGLSLREVLRSWGHDAGARALMLRAMTRVLDALHYAHKHAAEFGRGPGCVHGSISDESVRLSYSGDVMLTGFGSFEQPGDAIVAPECQAGAEPGPRADLYAAGCLLCKIAVGHDIVLHRGTPGELWALLGSLDDMLPDDQELVRVLRRAMRALPNERYATARQMRCDLDRVLATRTADIDWDDLLAEHPEACGGFATSSTSSAIAVKPRSHAMA